MLFIGELPAAIPADVNLGSTGSLVSPHLPDVLDPAGVVSGTSVLRPKKFEQRIKPFVNVLEVFAQFPAAVRAVLLKAGHDQSPIQFSRLTTRVSLYAVNLNRPHSSKCVLSRLLSRSPGLRIPR